MTAVTWLVIGFFFGRTVGMLVSSAAWRNGVTVGYGYAKEPRNPGYQAAGEYLRKFMAHRCPELRNQEQETRQA